MKHPYIQFENTKLWNVLDAVITELEENRDLKLETSRAYVIGNLCKQLVGANVVTDIAFLRQE
jgi:hypothetical protein